MAPFTPLRRARGGAPPRIRALASAVALTALAAACASSRPAIAHEYWLAPSTGRAAPSDTVVVRAVAGTGFRGAPKPFNGSRTLRLTFEAARAVSLTGLGRFGDTQWARVVPSDAGGAMLAYVSDASAVELPAAEFERYLALEGLDAPLAARLRQGPGRGPGREIYRRSCKAWLEGTDPGRSTRVYGLPLEIVPDGDPSREEALGFRVLFEGRPLAGALVRAFRQPLAGGALVPPSLRDSVGPACETRTDARGRGQLVLRGAGEWLVSTVHMEPNEDHAVSDWQSTWGSLWFVRPAAGGPARALRVARR